MPKISVVVCTHNPRPDYLGRALESLRRQTVPTSEWELVIVDNASNEPVSNRFDIKWHPRGRHVREDALGLAEARFRGIVETSGELIVFVDDDNVLAENYLAEAFRIAASSKYLGVFGAGVIEPAFEKSPSPEILKHVPLLAVRHVSAPRWSNQPDDHQTVPWGAGLIVSRWVADSYEAYVEQLGITRVLGRRASSLYGGDDDLFSSLAAMQGLGFGVFPQLRVMHLIGKDRVTGRHVLRLVHDRAISGSIRRYVVDGRAPEKADAFAYVRVLLHGLRNGTHSMRCRLAQLRGQNEAVRFIVEHQLHPADTTHIRRTPIVSRFEKVR